MIGASKKAIRNSSSQRHQRCRPMGMEILDQRLVCTGIATVMAATSVAPTQMLQVEQVIAVNGTSGSSMQAVTTDERTFALRFNQPIDGQLLTGNDLRVEQVLSDGSITALNARQTRLAEAIDPTDPTSQTLLVSFKAPLQDGNYQLVLDGTNSLISTAGATTSDQDQVVDQFSIGQEVQAPATLLGVGTSQQSPTNLLIPVTGRDLAGSLSKVVIAPGQGWVLTSDFGGMNPDDFQVDLLNDQKSLIASGSGSDLATIDQSLQPGTYYLLMTSTVPNSVAMPSSISVTFTPTSAQPLPSVAVAITPVNANHLSESPDTLLVQFADPAAAIGYLEDKTSVYTLVDGKGTTQAVTPIAYDSATDQLAIALASYLPTGHYALQVSTTDSSGSTTSTILGSFDTVQLALPVDDLGTIFPTNHQVAGGSSTQLDPGQSSSRTFSILLSQAYQCDLLNPAVSGELVQLASDGSIKTVIASPLGSQYYLQPGVYELIATNHTTTTQPVTFAVTPGASAETLSLGGVGQSPAFQGPSSLIAGSAKVGPTTPGDLTVATQNASPASSIGRSEEALEASPVASTGSFNHQFLNQAPLGSFSSGSSGAPAAASAPPISSAAFVVALNGTVHLNSMASTGSIVRFKSNPTVKDQFAGGPQQHSIADVIDAPRFELDLSAPVVVTSTVPGSALLTDLTIEELTAEPRYGTPADSDIIMTHEMVSLDVAPETSHLPFVEDDIASMRSEFASLTNPIGVLVGVSIAVCRIRSSQLGQKLIVRPCARFAIWRKERGWL